MTACPTCGASPCLNRDFCRACRDADRRKTRAEQPRFIDAALWRGPAEQIPSNWETMSMEALMAHFDRRRNGAPQATVEALMYSLREDGVRALEQEATRRRLSELSNEQVVEVGERLQRLKPEIARAWSEKEIEALLKTRIAK